MRVLGVDYGLKRIGLAIGETEAGMGFACQPMASRGDARSDAESVAALAAAEECGMVIVGLPLLTSGEEGDQARITKEFGAALEKLGVRVTYWDERFTTIAAEAALAHTSFKMRKELADSEAARLILDEYLKNSDD